MYNLHKDYVVNDDQWCASTCIWLIGTGLAVDLKTKWSSSWRTLVASLSSFEASVRYILLTKKGWKMKCEFGPKGTHSRKMLETIEWTNLGRIANKSNWDFVRSSQGCAIEMQRDFWSFHLFSFKQRLPLKPDRSVLNHWYNKICNKKEKKTTMTPLPGEKINNRGWLKLSLVFFSSAKQLLVPSSCGARKKLSWHGPPWESKKGIQWGLPTLMTWKHSQGCRAQRKLPKFLKYPKAAVNIFYS